MPSLRMKSPFPVTPTLRYERMFLAAMAAVMFGFLGLHFASMGMQVFAAAPPNWVFGLGAYSLRVLLFGLAGATFISLSLAFLLFALIKFEAVGKPQHHHVFVKARAVGMILVSFAFIFACFWLATNIGLSLTP